MRTDRQKVASHLLFLVVVGFFVAYGRHLGGEFYVWIGFVIIGFGLLLILFKPFTQLAQRYRARPGFMVIGIGTCMIGFGTMTEKYVPSFSTWYGKVAWAGVALVLVGFGLVWFATRKFPPQTERDADRHTGES